MILPWNKRREWFNLWFDTPFYHILYQHRDQQEARDFIDNLAVQFHLPKGSKVMDLACGQGRHSIYLSDKGYDVVGLDLSKQNIEAAQKFEHERLHFFVHDMRKLWKANEFDVVFNLFTSFGYFETEKENFSVIKAVEQSLKKGGGFVIDFLNPYTVINHLVSEEVKKIDGIEFHITKDVNEKNFIVKDIRFEHEGQKYHFQERVKAIRRVKFLEYFEKAGLKVLNIFGDYQLNDYVAEKSDRMIFILQK